MRLPRPGLFELVAAAFLAATAALAVQTAHAWIGQDFIIFGVAGKTLLSGAWLHAYADREVQAGPLQLALCAILRRLFGVYGTPLALVSDLLVAAMLVAAVRSFVGRRAAALAFVGAVAVTVGLITHPYTTGHFAEPVVGVLWMVAAREARRGRVLAAGAIVGLSSGFELWGILGISVLALAPRWRDAAKGVAVAGAVFTLLIGPFVAGGDFHMFAFQWHVTGGPLSLVVPGMTFGWPLRLLQSAIVLGIAIPFARRVRGLGAAIFLVPAATAIVRLSIDPMGTFYYWDAPLVIELVGAAAAISQLDAIRAWAAGRLGRLAPV